MTKKSKTLLILSVWFAYVATSGAYQIIFHTGEVGALWDAQVLVIEVVALVCAIGFFLQRKWAFWAYFGSLPLIIGMNFVWLRNHHPPHFFWGTMFLLAVLINLLPAPFIWFRRRRLTVKTMEAVNA